MVSKVCGLTDPFCPHASGAKYPDDSNTRTLAYAFRGSKSFTTTSSGTAAYLWNPQYGFDPFLNSDAPNRVFADVTAWTDAGAVGLLFGVTKYRIVSSGFTLRSIVAPLNASGEVVLRTFGTDAERLGAVNLLTYNCVESANIPLRLVNEVAVVTSHNSEMPQNFYPLSEDTGVLVDTVTRGFNPVTIYIQGAPGSTEVISVEFIINYELVFSDDIGMAQAATKSNPSNPVLSQTANKVTSALPGIFEKGAKAVATAVVTRVSTALATYIAGPAAGYAAGSATNYMIMD